MYTISLFLHSYTRWFVLIAVAWALWRAWHGLVTGRDWNRRDRQSGLFLAAITSIQFVLGLIVYGAPGSIARAALLDFASAMSIFELRFFSLEHPLQMIVAITLAHLGSSRSNKATINKLKFRWGAISYTLTAILILSAIPWWRPLFRSALQPVNAPQAAENTNFLVELEGDPGRGAEIFANGVDGAAPCSACHSITAEKIVGPGMAGVFERSQSTVEGQSAEIYLYNSITTPSAYLVEGFADVMPPNYGEQLTDQQIADLIAYLKTLTRK